MHQRSQQIRPGKQIFPKQNNPVAQAPTPPLFYQVNWTAPKYNFMLLEVIIDYGSALVTYRKITETKSSRKLRVSLYLRRFTKAQGHVTKATRRLALIVCTAMSQSRSSIFRNFRRALILRLALTNITVLLSLHFTSM